MNDRIHRVLDGELDANSLTPKVLQQLAAFTSLTDELAHALRRVRRPDLTEHVMAAIARQKPEEEPRPLTLIHRGWAWLWAPRSFAVVWRPAYTAVVLMVLLAAGVFIRSGDPLNTIAGMSAPADAVLYVQFRIEAPGASRVELAGSFTNWDSAVPLVESAPGVWSTLVALEPGVHDYAFVIDGSRWVSDPAAPAVDDGFGGFNSRLFLTRPSGNV